MAYILELAKKVPKLFKQSNLDQKRKLVGMLFLNCFLKDKNLDMELKKPFDIILQSSKTGNWRPLVDMFLENNMAIDFSLEPIQIDYMGTLEKSGEISCEILKEGPLGTYVANIRPAGFYRGEFKKTMYPKDWRIVDVLKANREAILSSKMEFEIKPNFVISYNGFFKNELAIQAYINKEGVLTTTFPDLSLR